MHGLIRNMLDKKRRKKDEVKANIVDLVYWLCSHDPAALVPVHPKPQDSFSVECQE